MKTYIVKRVLSVVPPLIYILFLCSVFISMIPPNPVEVILRVHQTLIIPEKAIEQVREESGLNDLYLVWYGRWVMNCLHLDLGTSYINPSRTALGEIERRLSAAAILAFISLVFVILLSLPIGFFCAVYKNSQFDRVVQEVVFMATAMSAYWIGLLLIWFIGIKLDLLPTGGNGGWKHLILPSSIIFLTYISTYIRLVRNNMLENMKGDYMLYANIRGLRRRSILVRYIPKSSLHACAVAIGMSIPQLITGTIVVENVFAWLGFGKLCVNSTFNRGYPTIQIYVLLTGILFMVSNPLFDIIQCIVDPRLRRGVS